MLEKKACKKLITEGKREEAKERMKRLNQTTMKEKENALNQLNVLRSQMDTLEQASSVKQLYRMKKLTFDAIPDTGVTLEEVENLVDDVTDEVLMRQGNAEGDTHDATAHAEFVLASRASRTYSKEKLWKCTLYTTCEPSHSERDSSQSSSQSSARGAYS